jgi:hypothetical protein
MSLAGSALEAALQAVGRGLDAAGDHRLLYCKGAGRLVALEEDRARDLRLPDGGVLPSVPPDVEVEQCRRDPQRIRPFPSGPGSAVADAPFVCSFDKVSWGASSRLKTSDRIVRRFLFYLFCTCDPNSSRCPVLRGGLLRVALCDSDASVGRWLSIST